MTKNLPLIPTNEDRIRAAVLRARRHVDRQALMSAGATFVPIPGVDMLVDVSVMIKMVDHINWEFGLTPEQIDRLPSQRRILAYQAISWAGTVLAGKVITAQLAISVLKSVGIKLGSKQAAKWVPVVGQISAAALGFTALRYLGREHIKDCEKIAREVILRLSAEESHLSSD